MLDSVTLDQLRTFIAAAEQGSFSAAGRKLRRAQSVVSQTLHNLEAQLGVSLFDRSGRYPRLTEAGVALLTEARGVADQMDSFKARARAMKDGLEPELSVVVDVMYPMEGLTRAAAHCREFSPNTSLRVYVEALGGVIRPVIDGVCRIGIVGSLPVIPDELASEPLIDLPFITVVAPSHSLAERKGPISRKHFEKQVQLVLTDRTTLSEGRTFGVLSPLTWHLADLGAKHAFLTAGLGWGHMPLHMVKKDLDAGTLVRIKIEGLPRESYLPMHVVYRKDTLPGPAGRAFISQLRL
ncbi:LysR family transcriptional regulator [Rothia nasimurium]|uniref:LysR family transcriptional regulator n=1 Tax=Luteibacter anthropi TaxID=564369 RepID=A0A7X5ZIZ7_9GAMM|nr:LysR family transcriptional regulator [Luteibacter anthropi]NII07205.1 LysR family transcriptional regulator [Luteibacter anthropi]